MRALPAVLLAVLCAGPLAAQDALVDVVLLRESPAAAPTVDPALPEQVAVFLDFAAVLSISGDVSTIVVGNANIADASVVATGSIAVTGKTVGTTNILLLQPDGRILSELRVQVVAQKPGTVTVRRAIQSSSYACTAASCQRSGGDADAAAAPPAE